MLVDLRNTELFEEKALLAFQILWNLRNSWALRLSTQHSNPRRFNWKRSGDTTFERAKTAILMIPLFLDSTSKMNWKTALRASVQ